MSFYGIVRHVDNRKEKYHITNVDDYKHALAALASIPTVRVGLVLVNKDQLLEVA